MEPLYRLDGSRERDRYLLHDNSLENGGYRSYLESFLEAVFSFSAICAGYTPGKWKILDYGSGPSPSLSVLMRKRGDEVRSWDPFFAPDTPRFRTGADLVTCLEVAEHFYEPRKDFALMARGLKAGGFLALGTQCIPSVPFDLWWYRQDPTHVSFYTESALSLVAATAGIGFLGKAAPHVYVFRKQGLKTARAAD